MLEKYPDVDEVISSIKAAKIKNKLFDSMLTRLGICRDENGNAVNSAVNSRRCFWKQQTLLLINSSNINLGQATQNSVSRTIFYFQVLIVAFLLPFVSSIFVPN